MWVDSAVKLSRLGPGRFRLWTGLVQFIRAHMAYGIHDRVRYVKVLE